MDAHTDGQLRPAPDGTADLTLPGGRQVRRWRAALGAVAVAAVLALPVAIGLGGATRGAAGLPADCYPLPLVTPDVSPLLPERHDWRPFVEIAVADLPPHTDYRLRGESGICAVPISAWPNASAVIDFGDGDGYQDVEIQLFAYGPFPTRCADVPPPQPVPDTVLPCIDSRHGVPMVFGTASRYIDTVTAVWPDHRSVVVSLGRSLDSAEVQHPTIGVDDIRAVATDPAMVALLPVMDRAPTWPPGVSSG